jgi:hypothetical protein
MLMYNANYYLPSNSFLEWPTSSEWMSVDGLLIGHEALAWPAGIPRSVLGQQHLKVERDVEHQRHHAAANRLPAPIRATARWADDAHPPTRLPLVALYCRTAWPARATATAFVRSQLMLRSASARIGHRRSFPQLARM